MTHIIPSLPFSHQGTNILRTLSPTLRNTILVELATHSIEGNPKQRMRELSKDTSFGISKIQADLISTFFESFEERTFPVTQNEFPYLQKTLQTLSRIDKNARNEDLKNRIFYQFHIHYFSTPSVDVVKFSKESILKAIENKIDKLLNKNHLSKDQQHLRVRLEEAFNLPSSQAAFTQAAQHSTIPYTGAAPITGKRETLTAPRAILPNLKRPLIFHIDPPLPTVTPPLSSGPVTVYRAILPRPSTPTLLNLTPEDEIEAILFG